MKRIHDRTGTGHNAAPHGGEDLEGNVIPHLDHIPFVG